MNTGLGAWRFFLAFLVAISHLWAGMIDGPAAYAVWGFFTLSGYLMTLVLTTRYGTGPEALLPFARNRLLRIYPSYLLTAGLGLLTLAALHRRGIDPASLNPQFMAPQSWLEWLTSAAMLPFVPVRGLPVPVAAALFVEVWAYTLMPLFARARSAAWLGLAVSVCANLQFGCGMDSFVPRYCGFATGLMPFALGAVVCHYRAALRRLVRPRLSVVAWCAHGLVWLHAPYWPWTYGLYLSVPLSAWVVLSLAGVKGGAVDRVAGDLSYPVYLLHTTVASCFLPVFGPARGFWFFATGFAATLLASAVMLAVVERPLRRLRIEAPNGRIRRPGAMNPVIAQVQRH